MKKISYMILSIFLCLTMSLNGQEIIPSDSPNETQKRMVERGYGMFMHFGVNTFVDMEWSDGSVPVSKYNPVSLDCDQWVKVARDAGFRYILLTTKHHDGFCLWDSKYTDYDVASSPVKTDVVAEVAKACKKYGIQFAIYYSLWDRNAPCYKDKDTEKYVDYMCGQLTELLTNYGPVCELWLDGGWDRPVKDWNLPKVYNLVKKLQPYCAMGVNHTIELKEGGRKFALPDSMIVDNKYYFQYFPSDFRLWDPKIAHKADKKQYLYKGESYYVPFEHTICISKYWSWFNKKEPQPSRDLDELEELFYWCTDNNNTLVMNIPPDYTGRIREHEANTAIALAKRLGLKKGFPLPKNGKFISMNAPVEVSSFENDKNGVHDGSKLLDGGMQTYWMAKDSLGHFIVTLNPDDSFNKISIFEYCDVKSSSDGFTNIRVNRIQKYKISILKNGMWQEIYLSDEPMGDCKVIRFPKSYKAEKIRFDVLESVGTPGIYEFNVIDFNRHK